jgi:1-acyl-sn-glycerol-3-phosphate acyltransferase
MPEAAAPDKSEPPKPAPKAPARAYVYRGEGTSLFQAFAWKFGWVLSRIISFLMFRLSAQGTENIPRTGGVLVITNHQSFLDPWLIGIPLHRQIHFMARDSLFKGGFLGYLLELLNSFPVRRGSADLAAIRTAIERIEQGRVVNIFPEGTRSEDGTIGTLAPGMVLILNRVKTPFVVVPLLIDGAFEAWPRKKKFPHPHRIRMAFGSAIPCAEFKGVKPEAVAARLREALIQLQEQINSPHAAASRAKLTAAPKP